jgi:hypothetical protein
MLWKYDGNIICMGAKTLPDSLRMEEIGSIYINSDSSIFYTCSTTSFLEQQNI